MRKLIIFLILLFSGSVFAGTYPATRDFTWTQWGVTYHYSDPQSAANQKMTAGGCTAGLPAILGDMGTNQWFYHPTVDDGNCVGTQSVSFVYVCSYGGTVSGSSCINAPACVTPQVRNTTTGMCENPPVTCNYTPTLTTVGATQTISWQTDNTATNSCTDNSVSCQAPLVANVEMKRCDLLCTDGTTVNVSGGAQCPPPVCVGGQTLNTATNTCEEPVCSALQVFNPTTHTCLDNAVCVGGQTQDTSTLPYSCKEPVCTGLQLLNMATHTCEDPAPAICVGGQILNTATNTCTDPVCPSGYHLNAGKVCENDGECPLFTTKTMVDGMLKCVTTPTSTNTREESTTTTPGVTSGTETRNPDGTISGSATTTTPGTTVTTTTNSTCDDCAKESTLREIAKKLDATEGTSTAGTGDAGKWYTATDKTYESILQDGLAQVQNSPIMSFGKDIFNVTIPAGSCTSWAIPAVMGMPSIDLPSVYSQPMEEAYPIVSAVLQILSVLIAFRLATSAV